MIDSSLFGYDLPAGTYAVGDVVELKPIAGPANVRSGRGAAILKRIMGGSLRSGQQTVWQIEVQNSDWIDEADVLASSITALTTLDEHSAAIRAGNDCPLTPNSSWKVTATCIVGATSTAPESIFALIDVDYPAVSGIVDPDNLTGIPTSIKFNKTGEVTNPLGSITTSNFSTVNVDQFKAGYKYALQEINYSSGSTATTGFVALSNAAGMAGLTRILPVSSPYTGIRQTVKYASLLVKGPMDIKTMIFNDTASAGTANIFIIQDFVKRAQA